MLTCLTPDQLDRDLAITDLSDPSAGPHATQQLAALAVTALTGAWNIPVRWYRGPRIVTVTDNYDDLGYQPGDVTRNARYTRYVDRHRMLRSHSTAMIPAALRQLAASPGPPDDVLVACPGIVYRRDAIDWQHTATPHQLDLWRISRRPLGPACLDQMTEALLGALLPGRAGGWSRGCTRTPPAGARRTWPMTAAGWKCGSAAWPPRSCWPGPGWPAGTGWPSAWAWTGC